MVHQKTQYLRGGIASLHLAEEHNDPVSGRRRSYKKRLRNPGLPRSIGQTESTCERSLQDHGRSGLVNPYEEYEGVLNSV